MELMITPIIGAAIGYCTNYIAIKMLFKPYNEKKILGIKLPFTPGLIPKERARIASSIGEVIENHLLTDEVIINELSSETMEQGAIAFVEKQLYDEEGQLNLKRILFFLEINDGWMKEGITTKIVESILNNINNEETKHKLVNGFTKQTIQLLNLYKIKDIRTGQVLINKQLQTALSSESFKAMIMKELQIIISDNKSVKELLPQQADALINTTINFNTPVIMDGILEAIKNEVLKEKLVDVINETIQAKLGAIGAMFANPNDIYKTIIEKAEEKLGETENQELIIGFIIQKVHELLDKELYEFIPHHMQEEIIADIAAGIQEKIAGIDVVSLLTDNIQEQSLYDSLVSVLQEETEAKIYGIIEKLYLQLISNDNIKITLTEVIRHIGDRLMEAKVSIGADQKEKVRSIVKEQYKKLVVGGVKQFTKDIPLGQIVENQLNSFEMEMLEEIILEIARKELRAITWFGALLGFIMGLLNLLV
jgi:uncharacterized membrane protein YheB (UPF0754 family)